MFFLSAGRNQPDSIFTAVRATAVYAQAQRADGVAGETQGDLPEEGEPARGRDHRTD